MGRLLAVACLMLALPLSGAAQRTRVRVAERVLDESTGFTGCIHVALSTREHIRELLTQGGELPTAWGPLLEDPWAHPAREQFR